MTMNGMRLSGAVAALVLASGPAWTSDHYARHGAVFDYARVLSVEPNIRYVTVRTPVQECWNETRYYTVDHRPPGNVVSTLFGAVLGGVIGHQFGSGHGNDAATVAGALAGAAIGSESARQAGYAPYETTEYARPVRQCQTRYSTHQEERIDSYRVIYVYNGQKYATDTPYDPGERIRIRVDVRPVP